MAVFTNEEGARFQPDMMGSLVYAGGCDLQEALQTRNSSGDILNDELKRIGYAGDLECGAITPCGKIIWELRSFLRAGYTPLEAIRAATSDADCW